MDRWIDGQIDRWRNRKVESKRLQLPWLHKLICKKIDRRWKDKLIDGQMKRQIDGQMDRWKDGQMDRQIYGLIDKFLDGFVK